MPHGARLSAPTPGREREEEREEDALFLLTLTLQLLLHRAAPPGSNQRGKTQGGPSSSRDEGEDPLHTPFPFIPWEASGPERKPPKVERPHPTQIWQRRWAMQERAALISHTFSKNHLLLYRRSCTT